MTTTISKGKTRTHRNPAAPTTRAEHAAIAATMKPFPELAPSKSVHEWAAEFRAADARCLEADVAKGKLLLEGKSDLGHGLFMTAVSEAGIDQTEADRVMAIARDEVLSDSANWPNLPAARSTCYEITKIKDAKIVKELMDNGKINPMTTKAQVQELRVALTKSTESKSKPKGWVVPNSVTDAVKLISDGTVTPDWAPDEFTAGRWLTKRKRAGDVTDAVLTMPGNMAFANTFTNLGKEFTAACFLTGATHPLIAMYFGERPDDFTAAFVELGPVLTPMA